MTFLATVVYTAWKKVFKSSQRNVSVFLCDYRELLRTNGLEIAVYDLISILSIYVCFSFNVTQQGQGLRFRRRVTIRACRSLRDWEREEFICLS